MLAIVSSSGVPLRTKGPDYVLNFHVHDRSSKEGSRVSLFRPYKAALPLVRVGDVILLRSFNVHSFNRQLYLRSREDSSWAIIRKDRLDISGPEPECGPEEYSMAAELAAWWARIGSQLVPRITIRETLGIAEIDEGIFFNTEGEVVTVPGTPSSPWILYITDFSRGNPKARTLGDLGVDSEEALCNVLPVELRGQDARFASRRIVPGMKISLTNVKATVDRNGFLFGILAAEDSGKLRVKILEEIATVDSHPISPS